MPCPVLKSQVSRGYQGKAGAGFPKMIIVTPVQGWDEDTHHFHAHLFTRTRVLRNLKEREKQMKADLDLGHWESIDTGNPPPDGECMKTVRLTRIIDSSI